MSYPIAYVDRVRLDGPLVWRLVVHEQAVVSGGCGQVAVAAIRWLFRREVYGTTRWSEAADVC